MADQDDDSSVHIEIDEIRSPDNEEETPGVNNDNAQAEDAEHMALPPADRRRNSTGEIDPIEVEAIQERAEHAETAPRAATPHLLRHSSTTPLFVESNEGSSSAQEFERGRHSESRATISSPSPSNPRKKWEKLRAIRQKSMKWLFEARGASERDVRHSSIVTDGGEEDEEEEEDFIQLDPDFDVSTKHLMKLFNALDSDNNQRLSYEQLHDGFRNLRHFASFNDEQLWDLVKRIDLENTNDISQEEFVKAIQDFSTQQNMTDCGKIKEMFRYDYGPDSAHCTHITASRKPEEGTLDWQTFLKLSPFPNPSYKVRWISVVGNHKNILVQLGNHFGLHHLEIEDMLNSKERPKVDSRAGALHVLIYRIARGKKDKLKLKRNQLNIFLLEGGVVLTVTKKPSDLNSTLMQRIVYGGSKVRLNDSKFLTYTIVDHIIDSIFPLMNEFRDLLIDLQKETHTEKATSLDTARTFQTIFREMTQMTHWMRLLGHVTHKLTDELPEGDDDLEHYCNDLKDHVNTLQEQAQSFAEWAKSLNDDYLNEQQYRMNQVMYILTVVTTIFIPGQFLTGVFGMNFEKMPELKWDYSYLFFWLVVMFLSLSVLSYFKKKQWL